MMKIQAGQDAYVMGYFRSGPGQTHKVEQLHYAYSRDGRRWFELNGNQPVWAASVGEGILRDPFIGRGADGRWHMVYTIRPKGPSIGYAVSDDLVHWTNERALPLMANIQDTVNSWAPEFSYDSAAGEYLVYWASSTGTDLSNSKHYAARTRDWRTFTPAELFFDPGFQTIDASIAEHEGRYYMAVKDESHVYEPDRYPHPPMNFLAVADRLEGPYEPMPGLRTPDYTEAPELLWIERDRKWLLLYDYWAYGKFGIMESTDMLRWSDELEAGKARIPHRARHATVFPVSEEELQRLLDRYALQARYPTPTYAPVRIAQWDPAGFLHDAFRFRTVTLEIRPDSITGSQMLYDEGDAVNGLALRVADGRLEGVVRSNGVELMLSSESGKIQTSRWQHIAIVYEEGRLSLYVDGTLMAEGTASFALVRAHDGPGGYGGRFGEDAFGDSEGESPFRGTIRDVQVYDAPLQREDILVAAR